MLRCNIDPENRMSGEKSLLLCRVSELEPGSMRRVDRADGAALAVYNVDGSFYATDDCCTHGLSSLTEGELDGELVECSMHFGGFDVRTGKAVLAPCTIDLKTYRVEVRDEEVYALLGDS